MNYADYDDIFTCFLDNCGTDVSSTIPSTNEGKYQMIHNGIRHYNTKVDSSVTKLTYDDSLEITNLLKDDLYYDTKILLLAYCIRYTFLDNSFTQFVETYQFYQKEIGMKFYGDQIKGRSETIERTDKKITELLTDLDDECLE